MEYAPKENSCPIRRPVPTGRVQRVLAELSSLVTAAAIRQHDFRGYRSRQRHVDERVATEEEEDNGHAGGARGVAGQEEAMLVVPLFYTRGQATLSGSASASPSPRSFTTALGLHSLFNSSVTRTSTTLHCNIDEEILVVVAAL